MIIEDNSDYRHDLKTALDLVAEISVVGDFSSYEETERVLAKKKFERPDVALVDIIMPDTNGIEAIEKLKIRLPSTDIITLTAMSDEAHVLEALCAGAMGYLLKTDGVSEIVRAIKVVHKGGSSLGGEIATLVLDVFNKTTQKRGAHDLENIQLEILRQLAEGLQKKEIATRLAIDSNQVHYHVRKIYKSLHVNSLSGAVGKAIRKGII
ncbi:MAG: response regulator transcription factor [Verrucomicrobiota bacterium]